MTQSWVFLLLERKKINKPKRTKRTNQTAAYFLVYNASSQIAINRLTITQSQLENLGNHFSCERLFSCINSYFYTETPYVQGLIPLVFVNMQLYLTLYWHHCGTYEYKAKQTFRLGALCTAFWSAMCAIMDSILQTDDEFYSLNPFWVSIDFIESLM